MDTKPPGAAPAAVARAARRIRLSDYHAYIAYKRLQNYQFMSENRVDRHFCI